MRENDITVNDRTTLKEMQTFVVNEAGKMTAEAKLPRRLRYGPRHRQPHSPRTLRAYRSP
jgi:hypothetical protein